MEIAEDAFQKEEALERQIESRFKYLYGQRGNQYSEFLLRAHNADYAHRVSQANLKICEENHFIKSISQCHRVLGDLDADSGDHVSARAHYESALRIARSISFRPSLIEALLARGRWHAKQPSTGSEQAQNADAAFNDLNEALGYCVESSYRRYEADVRVALGWANLADLTPNPSPKRKGEILAKAKAEAERALQMSNEMGYHWGKVDAEEVLEAMSL